MFFDEDGDLAHEFYEEVKVPGSTQTTAMRRKLVNLRPQVVTKIGWIQTSYNITVTTGPCLLQEPKTPRGFPHPYVYTNGQQIGEQKCTSTDPVHSLELHKR